MINLLHKRKADGALRKLTIGAPDLIDFSSNDYLGLAHSSVLNQRIKKKFAETPTKNGSTGSRLLTGNTTGIINLEDKLAHFFGYPSSTFFSSGYLANLAFFSTIPQKGDTVLYDEFSHACIKDGIRLSFAKRMPFRHNNLQDLKAKLKVAEGEVYIACESVYSMDGDLAPLESLTDIAKAAKAKLVIDEAHSTGIWGDQGQGLVHAAGLNDVVYAVIHTFGKALGMHGATLSGQKELKDCIVNFARPFIYTTAPSDHEVISIDQGIDYLVDQSNPRKDLFDRIKLFNELLPQSKSPSPIKSIIIGGNERTKCMSQQLLKEGFDIRPILSPTVKEGSERLRICLHSFNSDQEIISLCSHLKKMLN
jgi:8-amino-7-oxononanoate synthase